MTNWKVFLSLWLVAVPAGVPALAHHGADRASVYKGSATLDLTGTIARVEWMNPHVFLSLDVINAEGKATKWLLELGAPNALAAQGWTRDALKVGDRVTVSGTPANDGSANMYVRTVVTSGGQQLKDQTFARSGSESGFVKPEK